MAVDALLTVFGELSVGGRVYRFGEQQVKRHSTTADRVRQQQYVIPGGTPGAVVLIWTSIVDLPSTFKLLILETDKPVFLEFVVDEDGSVGEVSWTEELVPGCPRILGSQRSYAGHSPEFAAGTLDVVETLRARKLDATDATLRMLMVD